VTIRGFVALVVLGAACARPRPQPANPPRIQDSPPEQRAALDSAARLGLDAEKERWGIEKSEERKRQARDREEEQKSHKAVIPMPAPGGVPAIHDGGTDAGRD
jgi:hypothetical protein